MSSTRGPSIRRGPVAPTARRGASTVGSAPTSSVRARGGQTVSSAPARRSESSSRIPFDGGSETEAASGVSDSDEHLPSARANDTDIAPGNTKSEYRPPAESDEEENGQNGADGKAKTDNAPELLVEKKRAQKRRFTEEMLAGPCGLDRVYETFPSRCKFRGKGFEVNDLHNLVRMYQEWAFQLFPGLARDDLIDGVAKMGSKPLVRSHLMRMRDRERDRYMVEELGLRLPERSGAFDEPDATYPAGSAPGGDFTSPESVSQHAFHAPGESLSNRGGAQGSMINGAPFYREDPGVSLISLPDFDDACIALLDSAMTAGAGGPAPAATPQSASVTTPLGRGNAATPTTADALDRGDGGLVGDGADGEAEWDAEDFVVGIRESIAADEDEAV